MGRWRCKVTKKKLEVGEVEGKVPKKKVEMGRWRAR